MQALPAQPESLCIVEMGGAEKQDELGERGSIGFLYLNIGLQVRKPQGFFPALKQLFPLVGLLCSSCGPQPARQDSLSTAHSKK